MNITEMTLSVVIDDFCNNKIAFTSLDISNAIKDKWKNSNVSHADVAKVVRELYTDGNMKEKGYVSSIIIVTLSNKAKFNTILYHYKTYNTALYNKNGLNVLPVMAPKKEDVKIHVPVSKEYTSVSIKTKPLKEVVANLKSSVETVIDNLQSVSTDLTFVRNVKSDGRLEIPVELFTKLGWGEHYSERCVYLKNTDTSFIITKDVDLENKVFENYMSEGRVRVPKTVFVKCGLPCDSRNQYVISASSRVKNMIVVSLA